VRYNPDGPQSISDNGDIGTILPGIDSMYGEFANIPEVKNFKVPDWSAEAAMLQLAVTNDASAASQEKYAEALISIYNEYFLNPALMGIGYKDIATAKPDDFKSASVITDSALKETKSVPTPAPLADFQKALATTVLYTRNATALGANATDDPLKASLVMNAQQNNIDVALLNLQTQFQKETVQKVISARPELKTGVTALINNLLGVKTAYALCPTWDLPSLSHFIQALIKDIKEMILSLILQTVKNMVIRELQNVTKNFIRHSGAPRFVTNWLAYAANSLQRGAALAIDEVTLKLSNEFSGSLRASLLSTIGNPRPRSTMAAPPGAFYSNMFRGGGWGTFGSFLRPTNNYFGAYVASHDYVKEQAAEVKAQALAEAQASGGFKGARTGETAAAAAPGFGTEKICSNPQKITMPGGETNMENFVKGEENVGTWLIGDFECEEGKGCTATFCSKDDTSSKQIKTPGDAIAALAHNAVSKNGELVTTAQNIAGLVTAILQSFLTTLINESMSGW
jgi:hypothetical protein